MTANASFLFFSGGVRAKVLCPASPGKIYGQLTLGRHAVTADAYFFIFSGCRDLWHAHSQKTKKKWHQQSQKASPEHFAFVRVIF